MDHPWFQSKVLRLRPFIGIGRTPHRFFAPGCLASGMSWITGPQLRNVRIVFSVVIGIAFLLWGGCEWLVSTAQAKLKQRLADRGLSLTASSQSWSIRGGITFHGAELRRMSPGSDALIEFSGLHVGVLWKDAWRASSAVTRWQADDATLTLTDEQGAVSFQHLTTDFTVRDDTIDIAKLDTNNGSIAYALGGQIILATATEAAADTAFKRRRKFYSVKVAIRFGMVQRSSC